MQTNENILCCLSGAPSNGRVIRAAARMGQAFGSGFTALYVESPGAPATSSLRENLRLAEELGGRIITVYGDDPAVQIAEYARISGATKIVLGLSPKENRWRGGRSLIDRLGVQAPNWTCTSSPTPPPTPGTAAPPPWCGSGSHGRIFCAPSAFWRCVRW